MINFLTHREKINKAFEGGGRRDGWKEEDEEVLGEEKMGKSEKNKRVE